MSLLPFPLPHLISTMLLLLLFLSDSYIITHTHMYMCAFPYACMHVSMCVCVYACVHEFVCV